jgi:hypothetical protein
MNSQLSTLAAFLLAVSMLPLGGCVVGDHLTTFTIRPDGAADLTVFRSNLRSIEPGAKAEKDLADYKAKFDARKDDELARVLAAGGLIVEAKWLREQPPLANYVHALLPTADSLQKFLSIKTENGAQMTRTKFTSEGSRRKLSIEVTLPTKANPPPAAGVSVERVRQKLADGISETRIAVERGKITSARGFVVAADKQSALLDNGALEELLRTGGSDTLVLEWEVTP